MKLINSKTFELNPKRKITHQRIGVGQHHVLIIDDVFLYPDIVSHLMDELIYSDDLEIRKSGAGYRCDMAIPREKLYKEVFLEHYKFYPNIRTIDEQGCIFDKYFDGASIIQETSYPPHVDTHPNYQCNYAFVIYMNKKNLHGGTQFLRGAKPPYIESVNNDQDMQDVININHIIDYDKPWDYRSDQWTRYHMVEMKFNRLISYRSNILHAIYTDGKFYREKPRKTIVSNF